MKKLLLHFLVFTLCMNIKSSAQFMFGPQVGVDIATLTGTSFDVQNKPGWNGGLSIHIPINKHFFLSPAALYSMRGFKYDYDTTTTTTNNTQDTTVTIKTTVNVDATLGYLDVPVLITYFAKEGHGFFVQAGPQISFLITDNSTFTSSATISTNNSTPQPTTPTNSNTVSFNKSDISLVGGIGYKFPKLLFLYARAVTGLAKVQSGGEGYSKNIDAGHNFSFQAGVALCFGAK